MEKQIQSVEVKSGAGTLAIVFLILAGLAVLWVGWIILVQVFLPLATVFGIAFLIYVAVKFSSGMDSERFRDTAKRTAIETSEEVRRISGRGWKAANAARKAFTNELRCGNPPKNDNDGL